MGAQDNMSVVSKMTASTEAITVSTYGTVEDVASQTAPANDTGAMDTPHRAVHRISLSALSHNYGCVESAANRQRCSVIVVVKADGYGHGAVTTALHLADSCGAEAFAVATLEEGIALRRAFETTAPFEYIQNSTAGSPGDVSSLFNPPDAVTTASRATDDSGSSSRPDSPKTAQSMRPAKIRIIVLGPPVGYPRCFDDYYHYDIEVTVSGPEMANALMEWVSNPNERKRKQVARAAMETKAQAFNCSTPKDTTVRPGMVVATNEQEETTIDTSKKEATATATLSIVSGEGLAMEVRSILINQQAVKAKKKQPVTPTNSGRATPAETRCPCTAEPAAPVVPTTATAGTNGTKSQVFQGIEAVVKTSRNREVATARANALKAGEEIEPLDNSGHAATTAPVRRRLRWHMLVDSGMGRLGFKTDVESQGDVEEGQKQKRDTVVILKELVHAEIHNGAPIGKSTCAYSFHGLTHGRGPLSSVSLVHYFSGFVVDFCL